MEITITPSEMKALERQFMQESGIPGALLMEHAAQGLCSALHRYAPQKGTVLFLCGPGNNGGDGYAAARVWQSQGGRSIIAEMIDDAQGDALLNRRLALDARIPILPLHDALSLFPRCDALCDALFGTGLARPIEGLAATIITAANASGKPIVAADIPSGLCGHTGKVQGVAIRAAETVTFHRIKTGLVLGESAAYTGRITVHPILISQSYGDVGGLLCMSPPDMASCIPPRSPNAHKGSFGKIVLFAGSLGMAGAAAMCAKAALKTGAGLVYVLCRMSILSTVQTLVPGAVCIPLPEKDGQLLPDAVSLAERQLATATCAVIGCGIGQSADVLPLLACFRQAICPVVWDADALNLLSTHPQLLPLKSADIVTPHPGEASRLLRLSTAHMVENGLEALSLLHQKCGCHVLLKGARTLMRDGCNTAVNCFGSPAMAKGGSGDVLSGIIAGLMAQFGQRMDTLTIMQLAALVHGLSGLHAAKEYGEACVMPENLVDAIRLQWNEEL